MKKLQLLLVSVAMLSIFSCSDDDDDTLGVWYRRSDFDGRASTGKRLLGIQY